MRSLRPTVVSSSLSSRAKALRSFPRKASSMALVRSERVCRVNCNSCWRFAYSGHWPAMTRSLDVRDQCSVGTEMYTRRVIWRSSKAAMQSSRASSISSLAKASCSCVWRTKSSGKGAGTDFPSRRCFRRSTDISNPSKITLALCDWEKHAPRYAIARKKSDRACAKMRHIIRACR